MPCSRGLCGASRQVVVKLPFGFHVSMGLIFDSIGKRSGSVPHCCHELKHETYFEVRICDVSGMDGICTAIPCVPNYVCVQIRRLALAHADACVYNN